MWKKSIWSLLATAVLAAGIGTARAGSTTVTMTGVNDAAGEPLNISAVFTFNTNVLTVQLFNNQLNPKSAAQTIRGVTFNLNGGLNSITAGSFTTSGTPVTVDGQGAGQYTVGAGPSTLTAWTGSVSSGLYNISETGAEQLIIGGPNPITNAYDNSNSSITGDSHNPHEFLSGTFTLGIPGLTADSTLRFDESHTVTFLYGTGSESHASTGHTDTPPGGGGAGNPAPLPAAATGGLALMMGLGVTARIRRRMRQV